MEHLQIIISRMLNDTNSSSVFKKRLLRPVSNKKKMNTLLTKNNLKLLKASQSIDTKKRQKQTFTAIQQFIRRLQQTSIYLASNKIKTQLGYSSLSLRSCGIQYIKQRVQRRLKQKQKIDIQQFIFNTNPTSTNIGEQKQNFQRQKRSQSQYQQKNVRTIEQILSDYKQPSASDAALYLDQKYRYNKQVVQISQYVISILCLNFNPNQDMSFIQGLQDSTQILMKLLPVITDIIAIKQVSQQQKLQIMPRRRPQKFKTIFLSPSQQLQIGIQKQNQMLLQIQKLTKKLKQTEQKYTLQSYKWQNSSYLSQKPSQNLHRELQELYSKKFKSKEDQISRLNSQIVFLHQKLSKITQVESLVDKKNIKTNKDNKNKQTLKLDSYTQTVQDEYQKMRKGFAARLQKETSRYIQQQQEIKKELYQIKKQLQNCQWQYKVLLRKYEFLLTGK